MAWVVEPEPVMKVFLGREKAQDDFVQTKEAVGLGRDRPNAQERELLMLRLWQYMNNVDIDTLVTVLFKVNRGMNLQEISAAEVDVWMEVWNTWTCN
ncbi:hypothetical protein DVH24_016964 [Malus domestica]|uniref:Uncharacterized protein n=1 Tax=Malus domestica TaxID=3750 RepID=A0A498IX99_MALDO|nr:hypothetical protein DVH24_016964 [Malus domestica]